jgi:2-oxoglutarate dehydrogenase E2 component (dihydrolipoamide succinyltransferase)
MGESIAEGTMSRWLKKVGDTVKRDEPLFEISTDKVDAEIPAALAGVLAEILVTEGQTVPVQTVVARLETDASVSVSASAAAPAPVAASSAPIPAAPALPAPVVAAAPTPPRPPAAAVGSFEERVRTKSSPLVRRMAAAQGIELAALTGSGVAGRVTRKDLEGFIAAGAGRSAAPAAVSSAPMASMYAPGGFGFEPPAVEPWPGDVVEPMSRIRRLTAGHMVYSKHTSAHVTSFFEVDLTRVARVRAARRAEFEQQYGEKLTYLPFITRAVVDGLKKYPVLNAAVRGTDVVLRKSYNIGIAVAMDWGLIVPVVKRADTLNLVGLTKGINDLATRARTKRLKPDEVQDATFTITNPGVFGSVMGTPIIPQPTVAILCVGTIEKRPKVRPGPDGEDTIAIRTCTYLSISFDHRIVDGADADRFMAFVKEQLETIPEAGF